MLFFLLLDPSYLLCNYDFLNFFEQENQWTGHWFPSGLAITKVCGSHFPSCYPIFHCFDEHLTCFFLGCCHGSCIHNGTTSVKQVSLSTNLFTFNQKWIHFTKRANKTLNFLVYMNCKKYKIISLLLINNFVLFLYHLLFKLLFG